MGVFCWVGLGWFGFVFFFLFFLSEHIPVVLWTIALWSSKQGWAFSQHVFPVQREDCTIPLGWVSLQLNRNFSGFRWAWFTCRDSTEIFAPWNYIIFFGVKPAVELILVHYIINAYLSHRTILKTFRSLWHFWAWVVSRTRTLTLVMEITVPALIDNCSHHSRVPVCVCEDKKHILSKQTFKK